MPKLLVIDDRDQTIEMCHRNLPEFEYATRCDRKIPCQVCEERDRGCKLKSAHDWSEAQDVLQRQTTLPDLVVLDLHFALAEARLLPVDKSALPSDEAKRKAALEKLRRRQGLLILNELRAAYPSLPVVMLTTTDAELERAQDELVYFCENDIIDSRTLAAEIVRVLASHHAAIDGNVFWGQSRAMAALKQKVEVLARSPLPILIEGETGAGKSFLAEHVIHPRSGQKGPLVITDLSTIPSALLPAHLFGAKRGAYTGAIDDQSGVFEQAHSGTLFLDEIANLDLDLQRQLLLVIERRTVTRLGDSKPRPAEVKLVVATNQDLAALVRVGKFRSDLYMRLNPAVKLRVPPLRERQEDLSAMLEFALLAALRSDALRPLVTTFLARFPTPGAFDPAGNQVLFRPVSTELARPDAFTIFLSQRSLARICRHPWSGNQRELRLFATNALVQTLLEQLDSQAASPRRAPAIVVIAERVVDALIDSDAAVAPPASDGDTDAATSKRVVVEVEPQASFAAVSRAVEEQYMRQMYERASGDLDEMAKRLLGPKGTARQVHLRLNQLGLSLRELRRGQ